MQRLKGGGCTQANCCSGSIRPVAEDVLFSVPEENSRPANKIGRKQSLGSFTDTASEVEFSGVTLESRKPASSPTVSSDSPVVD